MTDAEVFMDHTLKIIGSHLQVKRHMGSSLQRGGRFTGSVTQMAADGSFQCQGKGSGGSSDYTNGTVRVVATSDPSDVHADWVYDRLDVEVQKRDRVVTISLTNPTAGDRRKHDLDRDFD